MLPGYRQQGILWDVSPMQNPDLRTVQAFIKRAIEKSEMSVSRLDAIIRDKRGRGGTLVKDILSGKSQNPTLESIREIADALGASVDDFLGGDGVPVVGFVGAGGEVVFEDDFQKGDGLYRVDGLPDMPIGMIGLEVRGDSMLPLFRNGYVAFIHRDSDQVEDAALQDWAIARVTDGRTLLKQIRRSAQPGLYDLLSLNADPIEAVELNWATPVRGWVTRAGR
jgi:phage repressor protein C with HTH and peptisase S24 domain